MNATNMKTFRYTFQDEVKDKLEQFSKLHCNDDRKTFKSAWDLWIKTDEARCIHYDAVRLALEGCTGDIYDKMYKSARYYHRKKDVKKQEKMELMEDKKREYLTFTDDILLTMDMHIKDVMNNKLNSTMSPAEIYHLFCKEHREDIQREVVIFCKQWGVKNADDLSLKFKKTYKKTLRKKILEIPEEMLVE